MERSALHRKLKTLSIHAANGKNIADKDYDGLEFETERLLEIES